MKHRAGILIVMLLVLGASSAAAAGPPIAEVENLGDELVFDPIVEFERLILTVTGPCSYEYQRVVSEGGVSFQLDETTIDGAYTYQLVRIEEIDGDVIETLELARAKNDEETPKALCRQGKLPGPPLVQAEGFLVAQREIIYDPEAVEKTAAADRDRTGIPTKDHLIYDDLIVDGSACIGFDCVNGESFGFDTLRLKENNLRIGFDDTSTAGSYPRNDWQLTANDSANGGANKFSIDDITGNRTPFTVEANARSHSLYVDDGGRIGNRTSTPSVEIHTIDGDTPTVRLQQDGSSGFAPQTWDVAGNETNFFIRDVTNGSTLPLRIRPGAPSSSIYIDVGGFVGLGTASPDDQLHIENESSSDTPGIRLVNTDVNDDGWSFRLSDADEFRISKQESGAVEFEIEPDGDVVIAGSLTTAGGSYPDYVFEADYSLMPLTELATYIEENGHLPNVPTAADVDGGRRINMTELQIRLLEKVEELTLYTLAQERTNAAQEKIIAELEARLAAIEGGADK